MNKKNKFFSGMLAAVVSAALLIPVAHAIPFTLDTLIGQVTLANSGDATELAKMQEFVSLLLGSLTTLTQDIKDVPTALANGVAGEWYIDVAPTTPGYFLLKFGVGGTDTDPGKGKPVPIVDHYFFQNIGELDKLVFSNAQVNFLSGGISSDPSLNIGRLSHYVTYNGDNPPCTNCNPVTVPEPTTLLLMSAGLFGFGFARHRRSA
jgi:hypothetical protein